MRFLQSKQLDEGYIKNSMSYLDRFVGGKVINNPMDILNLFSNLTIGQRHNLIPAVRALLKFLKLMGFSKDEVEAFREAIPKDECRGVDLWIPDEEQIATSVARMDKIHLLRYRAVYSLCLDSGLRLREAVRLLKSYVNGKIHIEKCDGFCVASLGYLRKSKVAYYGFFTEHTMGIMKSLESSEASELTAHKATAYVQKLSGVVAFKYLRKFAFDKVVDRKLGVPESVADFIEGRTPKTIGAKHYMILLRQAKQYYPRYAEYITRLRQKALS